MWKNAAERRMRVVCWTTRATNTHSEYVIFTAFPMQQWWQEGGSMLRYKYIVGIVLISERRREREVVSGGRRKGGCVWGQTKGRLCLEAE
jgi:hypothetical protein